MGDARLISALLSTGTSVTLLTRQLFLRRTSMVYREGHRQHERVLQAPVMGPPTMPTRRSMTLKAPMCPKHREPVRMHLLPILRLPITDQTMLLRHQLGLSTRARARAIGTKGEIALLKIPSQPLAPRFHVHLRKSHLLFPLLPRMHQQ